MRKKTHSYDVIRPPFLFVFAFAVYVQILIHTTRRFSTFGWMMNALHVVTFYSGFKLVKNFLFLASNKAKYVIYMLSLGKMLDFRPILWRCVRVYASSEEKVSRERDQCIEHIGKSAFAISRWKPKAPNTHMDVGMWGTHRFAFSICNVCRGEPHKPHTHTHTHARQIMWYVHIAHVPESKTKPNRIVHIFACIICWDYEIRMTLKSLFFSSFF